MKKISPLFFHVPLISLLLSFFVILFGNIGFIERISNGVNDVFTYKIRFQNNLHADNIVIVKIDDRTLDSLGRSDIGMSNFDKGTYADLIKNIFDHYDAEVVGVDVVFANASRLGKEDEQKLADIFAAYPQRISIATRSDYTPHPLCLYNEVQHGVIDSLKQERMRVFPLYDFEYDLIIFCPDTPIIQGNTEKISLLSREVLDQYIQRSNPFEAEKIKQNLSAFENISSKESFVDYFSNAKKHQGTIGYTSYSFIDIFQKKQQTPEGEMIDLKDKIVLIGEVGTLMQDSHLTPVFQNMKMPGVEINANILTTLLQGRVIQEVSLLVLFLSMFLIQVMLISLVVTQKTLWSCMSLFLTLLFIIIAGALLFDVGYIYNIFLCIVGATLSFFIAYIYRFQVTDKAKRMMKKQFSLYVSPDVVEEMSRHPDELLIQGEKREMSIFFSDIVSFTNISEAMVPEKLVQLLNEYFSEMTKIIHHHKGTLDKYIGDSVMCFFNAPLLQENHSYYACLTALEQQKKLKLLNQTWQAQGYPEIKIRIGLHCGEAIHGNIGSTDTRVSYTIMGDSVNLASRLEGVCKEYGIYICVSESIYTLQKDMFHFRELDTIAVKGKTQAVRIYQLIGPKNIELPVVVQEHFQKYAEALEIYRRGEYALAGKKWLENKADPTSYLMAQRCRDILDSKARVEQGVFIMTHK